MIDLTSSGSDLIENDISMAEVAPKPTHGTGSCMLRPIP